MINNINKLSEDQQIDLIKNFSWWRFVDVKAPSKRVKIEAIIASKGCAYQYMKDRDEDIQIEFVKSICSNSDFAWDVIVNREVDNKRALELYKKMKNVYGIMK
jgi:hypothetical protein